MVNAQGSRDPERRLDRPRRREYLFAAYATRWIDERAGLRPKTITLYRYLLRRHLEPGLGQVAIADIREARVRRWRKERLDAKVSEITVAKAYRLLKAIMNTAADGGLIRRNPCRIKGGGQETSPERPALTLAQVYELAEAVSLRYRALVLLGSFGSLRWGELAALRRKDIDLERRTITVERSLTEQPGGGFHFGPPKSAAGRRQVSFPEQITDDLRKHLDSSTGPADHDLVFTSPTGTPLRHANFRRRVWLPALDRASLPGIHFHDLRPTGNTLTANAGANLRDLMERMGHTSTRAALIYLHSTGDRQRALADALGELAQAELDKSKSKATRSRRRRSGTEVARRQDKAS